MRFCDGSATLLRDQPSAICSKSGRARRWPRWLALIHRGGDLWRRSRRSAPQDDADDAIAAQRSGGSLGGRSRGRLVAVSRRRAAATRAHCRRIRSSGSATGLCRQDPASRRYPGTSRRSRNGPTSPGGFTLRRGAAALRSGHRPSTRHLPGCYSLTTPGSLRRWRDGCSRMASTSRW